MAFDDVHVAPEDTATIVLDMLCEVMHALNTGREGDRIVCEHLGRALHADAAVTLALPPDQPPYIACTYPNTVEVRAIAEDLIARDVRAGEEEFAVEQLDDLGEVASMSILPVVPEQSAELGHGRLLAYSRRIPFNGSDLTMLQSAATALVALWPHAARAVRAQNTQDWVRDTVQARMTDRELQVLALLAEGLLATSIASRLRLSPRTVHKHLGNIYRKLGVHDRLVAVSLARLQGLVQSYPSSPDSPGHHD